MYLFLEKFRKDNASALYVCVYVGVCMYTSDIIQSNHWTMIALAYKSQHDWQRAAKLEINM